jgi:hypothetical protein
VQWNALSRWNLIGSSWVKLMWVSSEAGRDDLNGITYTGVAPMMSIFRPWVGETLSSIEVPPQAASIGAATLPATGVIQFSVFIPMDHEAQENPARWDNDCSDPCNDNAR